MIMLLLVCFVGCNNSSTVSKDEATKAPIESQSTAPSTTKAAAVTAMPSPSPTSSEDSITGMGNKPLNTFKLDVTLDDTNHKLVVKQNLTYCNNTGKELNDIYFNAIPEAFKKKGGGVHIQEISIGNDKCTMQPVKETVYKINLPTSLPAGEKLTIDMNYEVNIPKQKDRFGYNKTSYNLGNFIVTPAVYEESGFSVEPYVNLGDAFYTDIANYYVTIHSPEGYTVAASGEKNESGEYVAEKMRDFAFCADKSFKTLQDTYDDINILVYYSANAKKVADITMDAAKKSLKLFNKTFGKYPYKTLTCVMTKFTGNVGGMEYPSLVMLDTPTLSDEELEQLKDALANITCHEIAHQWFYALVGNDEIAHPWLDEGFAKFSEYLYAKQYSDDTAQFISDFYEDTYKQIKSDKKNKKTSVHFDWTLYDWNKKNPDQYINVYIDPACLLYQMEKQMGEEQFSSALKEYVKQFSYSFVTPDSFKEFWMSKGDFTELFKLYNL